jgi:hypothetical protein
LATLAAEKAVSVVMPRAMTTDTVFFAVALENGSCPPAVRPTHDSS